METKQKEIKEIKKEKTYLTELEISKVNELNHQEVKVKQLASELGLTIIRSEQLKIQLNNEQIELEKMNEKVKTELQQKYGSFTLSQEGEVIKEVTK